MAVRIQTQDDIVFGTMADASVTASHIRYMKASAAPVVKALTASVTAAVGERLRIPSGSLDIVHPAGETNNTYMRALIDPYWSGETFQIDLMTSVTAVVADSGYAQQTYSNMAISNESD